MHTRFYVRNKSRKRTLKSQQLLSLNGGVMSNFFKELCLSAFFNLPIIYVELV